MSPVALAPSNALALPDLASSGESMEMRSQAWKRLGVGEFLGQINWQNRPAQALSQALSQSSSNAIENVPTSLDALSYRLSVGQFFGAIAWGGASGTSPASIARLPDLEPAQLPDLDAFADSAADADAELTLDDIFGSFADF